MSGRDTHEAKKRAALMEELGRLGVRLTRPGGVVTRDLEMLVRAVRRGE